MRKVSFKIRDARQLHLKGRCFSGWSKVTDQTRHTEQTNHVFSVLLTKQMRNPLKESFLAMQYVHVATHRTTYCVAGTYPEDPDDPRGPPLRSGQLAQFLLLWRVAVRTEIVLKAIDENGDFLDQHDDEDDDDDDANENKQRRVTLTRGQTRTVRNR